MRRSTGALVTLAAMGGLAACGADPKVSRDRDASPTAAAATCGGGSVPIDSSQALVTRGGGCFPIGIHDTGLAQLPLIDPEWAPVVHGSSPLSTPVLVHGTVIDSHVSTSDNPPAHVTVDQNTEIALDPDEGSCLATGNIADLENLPIPTLGLEWEIGSYPAWAWAGKGDRIVALGRWIFDCGHPNPIPGKCHDAKAEPCLLDSDCSGGASCDSVIWGYRAELHPPQAVAVIREGRGAPMPQPGSGGVSAIPVTHADVFVSGDGGGAGDACVVAHHSPEELLGAPCFPLRDPLALSPAEAPPLNSVDFVFDVPLPPVPQPGTPSWRVEPQSTPAVAVPAALDIEPVLGPDPHLHVTVLMTEPVNGRLPTGLAATILAGWSGAAVPALEHVRVTVEGVTVNDPLKQPLPLDVPTPPGWRVEAAVNGEWQELSGLGGVAAPGFFPAPAVFDQWLAPDGRLRVHAQGASLGCQDTVRGQSLQATLAGFDGDMTRATACLFADSRDGGEVDVEFAGPQFGARASPYEVASGEGACSSTVTQNCAADSDCPAGESCQRPQSAYALRFHIDRLAGNAAEPSVSMSP